MLVHVFEAYDNGIHKFDHYSVATKTGTAQVAMDNGKGYYTDRHMHSFFGYFPAYDPKFLVFLFLKDPQQVKYASQTLIPPFMNITKFLMNYYDVFSTQIDNMQKIFKKIFKHIVVTIITWEAKLVLARYHPKIIVVTGSVGKTYTKDAKFSRCSLNSKLFAKARRALIVKLDFHSLFLDLLMVGIVSSHGLRLLAMDFALILKKQSYPEYLVLEVGAGKPNDIKSVAKWLAPDIVVVTRFPDRPVHVEFFGSTEKIIEEKSSIVYALKKDGLLILNHDDEKVYALHAKANRKTVSYGMQENATYHFTYPTYLYKTDGDVTIPVGIDFN